MKRTIKTFIPQGWSKWEIFGDYGILKSLDLNWGLDKKEMEQIYETPIRKVKVTIEEIK